MRRLLQLVVLISAWTLSARAATPLHALESAYADWRDAHHALDTLEAGSLRTVDGLGKDAWRSRRDAALRRFHRAPRPDGLNAADRRALELMTHDVDGATESEDLLARGADDDKGCAHAEAARTEHDLVAALYDCFSTLGNHLSFEGQVLTRTDGLELLHELPESPRREALFRAYTPLWTAINGTDEPGSPYRRLLAAVAAERSATGDRIDDAARTLGTDRATVKAWLIAALRAWSTATDPTEVEPWDYWVAHTSATQPLDARITAATVPRIAAAYFHDLGADLSGRDVLQDLAVRPHKAPLAYTDFIRIGRMTGHGWRPARVRVSANVDRGGLYITNEIIHENAHAAHMMALRTRPAFFDLGDAVFYEAFADVPAWSVASPDFQSRYLGVAMTPTASYEALFAGIMLDVAWGLFELELLDDPSQDPNALWTAITHRYLHIRAHPELSWWALRVQLVHEPGYMINYGLGAVLTADLRQRTRAAIGPFDAGNPQWYAFTAQHLLRDGEAADTADLVRRFLGRPVSVEALLDAMTAIGPTTLAH